MGWLSVDQMQDEILRVYPECGWRFKVLAMSDAQVAAIYNRMLSKGELKKEPERKPIEKSVVPTQPVVIDPWKLRCTTSDESAEYEQIKFKFGKED